MASTAKAYQSVLARREQVIEEMRRNYPERRLQDIGEIAYSVSEKTPEEIMKTGGFVPRDKKIYLLAPLLVLPILGSVDIYFNHKRVAAI